MQIGDQKTKLASSRFTLNLFMHTLIRLFQETRSFVVFFPPHCKSIFRKIPREFTFSIQDNCNFGVHDLARTKKSGAQPTESFSKCSRTLIFTPRESFKII